MSSIHSLYNKALLQLSLSPTIEGGDYQKAAELIAKSATVGLNVKRTSIWSLDPGFHEMVCICLYDNGSFQEDFVGYRLSEDDFPKYFKALSEQRTILASNARTHKDTAEFTESYLKPLDIYSMLDAPIRKEGKAVGIICCEQTEAIKEWTVEDESFVGALTDIAGRSLIAVDHRKAEKELKELNEELEQRITERTKNLEETIEELQNTQKQLVEAEKLASLGSLVAGVSHEVNTPLGVGLTSSTLLKEKVQHLNTLFDNQKLSQSALTDFLKEARETCDILENNLYKAANLITNFKQLAVNQSSDQTFTFNVYETLHASLISLSHILKKNHIKSKLNCDKSLKITSNAGELSQIATNLILNASIHAFNESSVDPSIEIDVTEPSNNKLEIRFSDNGKGMSKEVMKKAFEPFFTTKRGQGGSGLGLHLIYNLVTHKFKGNIAIESELSHGTSIILNFPTRLETT